MFRYFVDQGATPMSDLSDLHPVIIESLLERAWNAQINVGPPVAGPLPPGARPGQPLGHPDRRSDNPGRPDELLNPVLAFKQVRSLLPPAPDGARPTIDVPALDTRIRKLGTRWHHLIYAYMIENTRVLEVFRRVLDTFLHGEKLSALSPQSQRWLWTTEELFYRAPPSFSVATQTSEIRPSLAATRANAYQRMFGMTLNPVDGKQAPFTVAEHANTDFVQVMDDFLHEVWQGRSNFANSVGARPTDDQKIAELSTRMADMLRARRINGTLSREEFLAISELSWFHATLETANHAIVVDLRAEAPSPEERLFKIAQRVGCPAHGLAKSYFEIAEPMSRLLISIEQEIYNDAAAVPALYTPTTPPGQSIDLDIITTHWSIIRGRDVKAKKVAAA